MENSSGGLNGFAVGMVIFVLFAIVACGAMLTSSVQSPSATHDPYRATYTAQANARIMLQTGMTATVAEFDRSATATQAAINSLTARNTSEAAAASYTQEAYAKTQVSIQATEAQNSRNVEATQASIRATQVAQAEETEHARQVEARNMASTETSARYTQVANETQTALNIQVQQAIIKEQEAISDARAYEAKAAAERIKLTNELAAWFPYIFGTLFLIVIILIAVWVFNRQTNTTPHYADHKGAYPVFTDRKGRVLLPEASGHPVIDPDKRDNLSDESALRLGLAGKGVAGIRALPNGMSNAARKGVRELTRPQDAPATDYKMLGSGDLKGEDMQVLDADWQDVEE